MSHSSIRLLSALLITALLAGCGVFRATTTQEQTTGHVADAALIVESRNGQIEVVGDPAATDVQVTARITAGGSSQQEANDRLAQTKLTLTRDTSGALTVRTDFPQPHKNGDGANLTIRIPGAVKVDATTSNGAIEISNLDATTTLKTSNGRITLRDMTGDAKLTTSNGRITIENHAGEVSATTSNGPVELTGLAGKASVRTSNGGITVTLAPDQAGPLDLQTSNGRITATVGAAFGGEISLNTTNGSIRIQDEAGTIRSQNIQLGSGTVVMSTDGWPSRLRTSNGRIELKTTAEDS